MLRDELLPVDGGCLRVIVSEGVVIRSWMLMTDSSSTVLVVIDELIESHERVFEDRD